jgi:hypothetical protein
VFQDAGRGITVADYLSVIPTDDLLDRIDSFRKYPVRYVPVNDPANTESIKRKFRDDKTYSILVSKPFVRKLDHSIFVFGQVVQD